MNIQLLLVPYDYARAVRAVAPAPSAWFAPAWLLIYTVMGTSPPPSASSRMIRHIYPPKSGPRSLAGEWPPQFARLDQLIAKGHLVRGRTPGYLWLNQRPMLSENGRTRMSRRRIFWFVLLAPIIAGCTATHHILFSSGMGLEHATGVTTHSGREIEFAMAGATIANDTLYASGPHGEFALPADSIALISTRQFSSLATLVLIGSVAAAALLAFAAIVGNASGGT